MSVPAALQAARELLNPWPQYFAGEHDGLSPRPHTKLLRIMMSPLSSDTNDVQFWASVVALSSGMSREHTARV